MRESQGVAEGGHGDGMTMVGKGDVAGSPSNQQRQQRDSPGFCSHMTSLHTGLACLSVLHGTSNLLSTICLILTLRWDSKHIQIPRWSGRKPLVSRAG